MKTKLLGILSITLGLFLFAGVAAAEDADVLQPASDIIYNENVDINGSLNTDSLRVGTAGSGGVTFFNGTVLNEGADPFTVGDDMRVDGEIWRVEKGGANPLNISDSVIPTLTNANDFGSTSNRWKNVYGKNLNLSNNLYVGGVMTGGGSVVIDDDLEVNKTLTVERDANFKGDINQDLSKRGAVKALVYGDKNGGCKKVWTYDNSSVKCEKWDTGRYTVKFDFNIEDNNFWQATATWWHVNVAYPSGKDLTIYVDSSTVAKDADYMITIY